MNGLELVRLAEIGGFLADCIHIWEPKGRQYQLVHIISSFGFYLILYRILPPILVICHHFYSNGIGLKLNWLFSGRQAIFWTRTVLFYRLHTLRQLLHYLILAYHVQTTTD